MKFKHIHFVGIKGVGMTPLALIAKEAGCIVTGSDIADTFITDVPLRKAGITSFVGFKPEHIQNADLVITTGAHGGYSNSEVKSAQEKGIPVLTQGEAVGEFMNGELFERQLTGISIAGTHGKTTTTALLATILMQAGLDPSYVIGTSDIPTLEAPGHYGNGDYFVAEADEYATEPISNTTAKFLWQHPKITVVTNIEYDHPDIYPALSSVIEAFVQFSHQIRPDGVLIVYGDDENTQTMLKQYDGEKITFGVGELNDYIIYDVNVSNGMTSFHLKRADRELDIFELSVFGRHNILNATGAIIAALTVGVNISVIQAALLSFKGSRRRSEFVGTLSGGAVLFDDYAHHPTEIKKQLSAFREAYPNRKIICVFQPHTYSRTKNLFEEFSKSFNDVDEVLITDIYASLREVTDISVTSEKLVAKIKQSGKNARYLASLSDVIQYISNMHYGKECVLITMGAGDIYTVAEDILNA